MICLGDCILSSKSEYNGPNHSLKKERQNIDRRTISQHASKRITKFHIQQIREKNMNDVIMRLWSESQVIQTKGWEGGERWGDGGQEVGEQESEWGL